MMDNQHTYFPVGAHIQTRRIISRIEGPNITIKKSKPGYALGVLEGVGLFVAFEDGYRVLTPNEIEYPRYRPGELVHVRNNFGDSFYQAKVIYKKKRSPPAGIPFKFPTYIVEIIPGRRHFLCFAFHMRKSIWTDSVVQQKLLLARKALYKDINNRIKFVSATKTL